jgi:peptidoglycan/LPS O-acetylase OafA/YrhL
VGIVITAFRNGNLNVGASVGDAIYGYLRFAFSFPLGVLLYRLHAAERLPRINLPPLLVLGAVALLLSGSGLQIPFYDVIVALLLFPLILVAAIDREPPSRWVASFSLSGAISYPLYILHQPVTALIFTIMPYGPLHVALLWCVPPFFVLGAYLADRTFDRPVQKWLKAQFLPVAVPLAS